jgi:hypothetical protein
MGVSREFASIVAGCWLMSSHPNESHEHDFALLNTLINNFDLYCRLEFELSEQIEAKELKAPVLITGSQSCLNSVSGFSPKTLHEFQLLYPHAPAQLIAFILSAWDFLSSRVDPKSSI